jgi:hypothetical protein
MIFADINVIDVDNYNIGQIMEPNQDIIDPNMNSDKD